MAEATSTSRPRRRLVIAAVALVSACTGCTASHSAAVLHPTAAPATSRPAVAVPSGPHVEGGVALTRAPCQSPLPVNWQTAMQRGTLWHALPETEGLGAPSPDGLILQQSNDAKTAHIVLVGRNQRAVQPVATLARPDGAQYGYTAVTAGYVAFVYSLTNGQQAQSLWDLYLFNRSTGKLALVTHSPRDMHGTPLQGGWVDPILTDRYLIWIQAAETGLPWGGSEVRAYDLTTGTTRTLYRGLASSVTAIGTSAIFTEVAPHTPATVTNPPFTVAMVDLATGRPQPVPAGITAGTDQAFMMRYDAGTLIWNTNTGQLRGWRADWGRSITLLPGNADVWPLGQKIGMSGAGYLRIHGHYVVAQDGVPVVLDLKTNSLAVLASHAGGEDMSGSTVSVAQYSSETKPVYGQPANYDVTVFNIDGLPDLAGCP